ncbi:MAG: tRNA-dihydrouridine synthase family protein [Lentimicrobium sp.]|nr:tRNA-dihydrouridine synthase family protein [Lentimicrobium sp.]
MSQQPVSIYFAPFQGITTKPFRALYARHFQGVDKLYTPYFSNFAVGHTLPPLKQKALKDQFENGVEVVPQVLSKSAEEILSFANSCEVLGFRELNWNLGCPYPQVARKKRGSGILPFPDMVDEILEKVMKEIHISFSVKCRLGYLSAEEMVALIPVFNRYPIHELAIHARIGKQLYSGKPDLVSFAEAARQLQMPVVYNGDIFTPEDFGRFRNRFPEINLLMVGRGILYDPFLPSLIKGFELPPDPAKTIRTFIDDLYRTYRKERDDNPSVLNAMKEYWVYLAESFDEPVKAFRKVRKAKTFDDYEEAISLIFEDCKWVGAGSRLYF